MSQPSVRLTGWKAVVVLVAVLAFGGYRWVSARQSLDTQGREALEEWVSMEIRRGLLDDSEMDLEAQAQALLDAGEVRIEELSARGPLDDLVVKVELAPDPRLPEGTERVRYYRMSYSSVAGWRHRGDASALAYQLAFF